MTDKVLQPDTTKSYTKIELLHVPLEINNTELIQINEDIADLFNKDILLRTWYIKGKLSSFEKDLVVY